MPVPAARLARALLMTISALQPGLLRPPERPPGLGSFLFFALPRHLVLSPPVRAHYPLKGCQLVSSAYRLIRREMIFKGLLSVVTADPLTLSLLCGCDGLL